MRAQSLGGRTALVTGGGRGIGLELTRQLIAEGARVIVTGRNTQNLGKEAEANAGQVVPFAADLTLADERERLVTFVRENHPELSLLFNNAASQTEADLLNGEMQANRGVARSEIALNLEAPVDLAIALLPVLAGQSEAAIINVTTGLAIAPKADAPVYCATKAGLRSFTRALRYQCQDRAGTIRVHEAVMSLVDTDMTRARGAGRSRLNKPRARSWRAFEPVARKSGSGKRAC